MHNVLIKGGVLISWVILYTSLCVIIMIWYATRVLTLYRQIASYGWVYVLHVGDHEVA